MTLDKRIAQLQAAAGATDTERHLLQARVAAIGGHGTRNPGQNEVHLVVFKDNSRAFFKSFTGQSPRLARLYGHSPFEVPVNEVVAWRLAHRLGPPYDRLVPVSVLRELQIGGGALIAPQHGDPHTLDLTRARAQIHHAAFWDALVGQQDRHLAQYRYDSERNRLGLIDHGYCFARPGDSPNVSDFVAVRRSHGATMLSRRELDVLDELIDSPDLHGLRTFLAEDRAAALCDRAERMRSSRMLLLPKQF